MKGLTKQEFIEKGNWVHTNKYNYDRVNYINRRTKVIIICPIHGEFEQQAGSHLQGCGCPKCANNLKYTTDSFIDRSNIIHSNRYDYSLVNYVDNKTKVKIICKVHGVFEQIPNGHLQGWGCEKCSYELRGEQHRSNTESFIKSAFLVHRDLYNYDKVNYTNCSDAVIIICKEHGEFYQRPSDHLGGCGCPACNYSKKELLIFNWLKENRIRFKSQFELITSEVARNSNLIKIDFFVKQNEQQYFIEYDGIQHFEYVPYFHKEGIIDFDKQQRRDKVLNDFCELHKDRVTLIRFNYKQTNEEILKIMNSTFNVF